MGSIGHDVPSLDFSLFTHGTSAQQTEFCATLKDVLSRLGFIKLKNHIIPKQTMYEAFEWSKRFFSMPLEDKMKAAHPPRPNPHRGYSYVGQEKLSRVKDFEKGIMTDEEKRDIKESYDQGSQYDELYPNIWPDEKDIPSFQKFMTDLYERCHEMHMVLLEAIALAFAFPRPFFRQLCETNTSELRMNHYPAIQRSQLAQGTRRISEHTDFGTVTLLFQDMIGGLEIERQDGPGEYMPVEANDPTEMIVNVGDCLQRWTNDQLRSACHRVTAPCSGPDDPESVIEDRYSIAYFGKPNRDVSVATMPEFVKSGCLPKYVKPMTAWEYNQSKLLRTY
ncbi:uncharacterized protein Z518_08925 [Rhinocladiella mackenziei CBS 650.93]|uniref:Fe2OG dioxygenase domain-containing protein n=1 Tax=Rhinocladiella mackenziei CBS 650.93 TaxID=1442369 RepID=A0A0D2IX67_9EURO|nr:uncharacterized protein Z518_08925 [Rhinocladiella mackenziei CBS 650.93]KIX01200.1 hypothetical protein Z518_08925 [Rhinocladiella mackenziei CBS 650.93]